MTTVEIESSEGKLFNNGETSTLNDAPDDDVGFVKDESILDVILETKHEVAVGEQAHIKNRWVDLPSDSDDDFNPL